MLDLQGRRLRTESLQLANASKAGVYTCICICKAMPSV